MTILEALKQEDSGLRVSSGNIWLVWDKTLNEWVVYSRGYYQKKTRTVYRGSDENKAVKALLQD